MKDTENSSPTDHGICNAQDECCGRGCMNSGGTCCGDDFFCHVDETCSDSNDGGTMECCVLGNCAPATRVQLFSVGTAVTTPTGSPSDQRDHPLAVVLDAISEANDTRKSLGMITVQIPAPIIKNKLFAEDLNPICPPCFCSQADCNSACCI